MEEGPSVLQSMLEPGASTHTQLLRYFSPRRRLNFRSDTVSGDTDDTYNYRKIVPVVRLGGLAPARPIIRMASRRALQSRLMVHALYTALYAICMHDIQECVAVRYILAWSCPCRCVCLEPGYKSLITPPFRDIAGIYALCTWALCVYMRHITRGGVYN